MRARRLRGGGSAQGRQGTCGRRADGEAPRLGDPDRRRLPRADMPQIDGLRGKLIEHGARLNVVKNTLTRRAAEAAGADALLALLDGPSAIAFIEADGDIVAVAKALANSARDTKVLEIRGGVMQGRTISAADVEELAKLPPFDVLRGQVLGGDHRSADRAVGAPEYTAPGSLRPDRRPHRATRRRTGPTGRRGCGRARRGGRACRRTQSPPSRRSRPPKQSRPLKQSPPRRKSPPRQNPKQLPKPRRHRDGRR